MKVYKEKLSFAVNSPIVIALPGKLLSIEKQGTSFVVYFQSLPHLIANYEIWFLETGFNTNKYVGQYYKTFMLYNDTYVLHAFAKEIVI